MGRNSISYFSRTEYLNNGFRDFERKKCAILQTTSVLICSMVRSVSQELVQQIAIGSMDFDTVKTSRFGILGSASKLIDDVWHLFQFECAWCLYFLLAKQGMNIALNWKCRGCYWFISVLKIRMRYSPYMPELKENPAP